MTINSVQQKEDKSFAKRLCVHALDFFHTAISAQVYTLNIIKMVSLRRGHIHTHATLHEHTQMDGNLSSRFGYFYIGDARPRVVNIKNKYTKQR